MTTQPHHPAWCIDPHADPMSDVHFGPYKPVSEGSALETQLSQTPGAEPTVYVGGTGHDVIDLSLADAMALALSLAERVAEAGADAALRLSWIAEQLATFTPAQRAYVAEHWAEIASGDLTADATLASPDWPA